ncbi:MAG: cellulase family glycosylhydrolase, partial [bacterium]
MSIVLLSGAICVSGHAQEVKPGESGDVNRWSKEKANAWYAEQPWLVGCNFIPSTAINQLEMWQADTFDAATIDRELKWAAGLGFNTVRVYLHDLAYEADADGFKKRIDQFLGLAAKYNITPMLVLFDDCWNANPKVGKQPEPQPGVHNSGWLQSPGRDVVNNPALWPRLEKYLKDVVGTFAKDKRVLLWDLYNEPGNEGQGNKSLPLLKKAFQWARESNPTQPLTAGVWTGFKDFNDFQEAASDVITFHNYNDAGSLAGQIAGLKKHGRPVICTEWMRRGNSDVAACLPVFLKAKVGCINWGLVAGKTQTIYPWGSPKGAPEPKVWFHDLLRKDGTPFNAEEAAIFSNFVAKSRAVVRVIVPTSEGEGSNWRYTVEQPAADWQMPGFKDAAWKEGPGGFGTKDTPGGVIRTEWNTKDIWLRREFDWKADKAAKPVLSFRHDEDLEVYINGVQVCKAGGFIGEYEETALPPEGIAALKPG